jgi:hypothetical protein
MSVEIALQSTLVSGDHSGALPNAASCAIHIKATFGRQCPSNRSPYFCYTDSAHSSEAVALRLHQNINHGAVLIDGTPEIMLHAVDL